MIAPAQFQKIKFLFGGLGIYSEDKFEFPHVSMTEIKYSDES